MMDSDTNILSHQRKVFFRVFPSSELGTLSKYCVRKEINTSDMETSYVEHAYGPT